MKPEDNAPPQSTFQGMGVALQGETPAAVPPAVTHSPVFASGSRLLDGVDLASAVGLKKLEVKHLTTKSIVLNLLSSYLGQILHSCYYFIVQVGFFVPAPTTRHSYRNFESRYCLKAKHSWEAPDPTRKTHVCTLRVPDCPRRFCDPPLLSKAG